MTDANPRVARLRAKMAEEDGSAYCASKAGLP